MIPLAQYFAESGNDDFKPLRNKPERRNVTPLQRPIDTLPKVAAPAKAAKPTAMRVASAPAQAQPVHRAGPAGAPKQQAPAAQKPPAAATPKPQAPAEPKISLKDVEIERAAWRQEREAAEREARKAAEVARRDGTAAGRAAAREELQADYDARVDAVCAELNQRHKVNLDASRASWTSEQADRLADLVILQIAILEETIKVSLNNVLRPLALDARKRQTLDDLVGAVRTIALDGQAFKIAAAGPTDLLDALEVRLGDEARLLSFEPDDNRADIRIDADKTVIETRLSSWQQALEEALS